MRPAIAVFLLLVTTACGDDAERAAVVVVDEPKLVSSRSCADLEQMVETAAIREMNADIDAIIDEIENGDDRGGGPATVPGAVASPTAPEGNGAGATDYTTTNTQERGVDEPDYVKNDGSRLFVLQGRLLVGLRTWPPETTSIVSETAIEGRPQSMLLDRDRLVVFSGVYMPGLGDSTDRPRGEPWPAGSIAPWWEPTNTVKITVFDVSSETPRVLEEQYLEGFFLEARRNDRSVRVVSTARRRGPELLYWPEGRVDWSSKDAARAAMEKVRQENVRRIRNSVASDWLPRAFVRRAAGVEEVPRDCSSFASSDASTRLGFTTITTLELSGGTTEHSTLMARAELVYASPRSLYLAAPHEWYRHSSETNVREDHTYLFQYDLGADARTVRQVGAGGVDGTILNSFSMDEEGGFLRVCSTLRTWLGWRLQATNNALAVLRASGGRLLPVGEITGLANGEQLYAARFEGPHGFLVTFRNVDPLFTVDLGDPHNPRVAGELKVPGYSTYLHLLDANDLLTVGRAGSPDGRLIGGVQLQVFDVSNFSQPVVRQQYALGSQYSGSEAEYDHKAFTYLSSREILALPHSDWSRSSHGSGFVSTLELLRVGPHSGITPLGAVDHADLVERANSSWPGFSAQVRRSVLADDYVYSISQGGLKVNDTRDLSRTLATVPFPALE